MRKRRHGLFVLAFVGLAMTGSGRRIPACGATSCWRHREARSAVAIQARRTRLPRPCGARN